MQTREKILAAVLAAVLVGGVLVPRGWRAYNAPLKERAARLELLSKKLDSLSFDKKIAQAKLRKVALWATRCLPANPQTAQLLYQQWVNDLAEEVARLQNVNVAPERLVASRDGAYVGVRVKLTAQGNMEQIARFLHLLQEVDLMHRVVSLILENRRGPDSEILNLSLTLEGLSLPNAPERGLTLFPRTKLARNVDQKSNTALVESAADFPKKPPFRIRIGGELARVVKIDGTTWTLERGLDGTSAGAHAAGTTVELLPIQHQPKKEKGDQYDVLLALNPFVKPRPPKPEGPPPNYPPEIEAIDPITVTPGELVTFNVSAWDFETPDKVTYSLGSGAPPGATIDPQSGRFQWQTSPDTPPGEYRITVQATDGGQPPLTASRTVTVTVAQDTARFVYLTAALSKNDVREAWLYDRSSNKRLILHEGDHLKYAGVDANVARIGRDFVWLETQRALMEMRLGDNLRSLRKLKDLAEAKPLEQPVQPQQPSGQSVQAAEPQSKQQVAEGSSETGQQSPKPAQPDQSVKEQPEAKGEAAHPQAQVASQASKATTDSSAQQSEQQMEKPSVSKPPLVSTDDSSSTAETPPTAASSSDSKAPQAADEQAQPDDQSQEAQ